MGDTVILNWSYTPNNFFEEPLEREAGQYTLKIGDGKITATMDAVIYDNNPDIRDEIHDNLEHRFKGMQLHNDKLYELDDGPKYRRLPDGRQGVEIFAPTIKLKLTAPPPDIENLDSKGNIIHSTKVERIREVNCSGDLGSKYGSDSVANAILRAHANATIDPRKCLVYLYEITEALEVKFKHRDPACKAVNIEPNDWDRLRRLANNEPLEEGRHSGKKFDSLRPATTEELEEAKAISKQLVIGYLKYLDRNT